jgi:hypothetical protein
MKLFFAEKLAGGALKVCIEVPMGAPASRRRTFNVVWCGDFVNRHG